MHRQRGEPRLLSGGPGDDAIDGGSGRDELDYGNSPTGVRVNLAKGTAAGWGTDRLRSRSEQLGRGLEVGAPGAVRRHKGPRVRRTPLG
jgi:hypothetical protein